MTMGRPFTRNIDFELLKKLIDKGFTINETTNILKIPMNTIQYYARTRNLGKFSRYKIGKYDKQILEAMEKNNFNSTKAAKDVGIAQSHIYLRYKNLIKYQELKEERFKWLMKNYPMLYANVVEKD